MMDNLKPCPYRIYAERIMSPTVPGEYYYREEFRPCMRKLCACYHVDCGDAYCDRGGAYMKLGRENDG